jgi:hypothetical protein
MQSFPIFRDALTQLVNQTLSAIKENSVSVYRAHFSIDASTRASDPNKDFFFNFAPQWVTEEKKLNSHPIKQHIDYCSYFKKKHQCTRTPAKAAVNLSKLMFFFKLTISDSRTAGLQSMKTLAQDTIMSRTSDCNV